MVDKFLRDLIAFLTPDYAICPRSTSVAAERYICEALQIRMHQPISWQEGDRYKVVKSPNDIIPSLEKLLGRVLDCDDLTIYLLCAGHSGRVVKTRLDRIVEHYADMPWTDAVWMWNPLLGYVVEGCEKGEIVVGAVPPKDDLKAFFTTRKGAVLRTEARKDALVDSIMHPVDYATIGVVGGITANQFLATLAEHVPFTKWGHVDWTRIGRKMWIGSDICHIKQAFERLSGSSWNPATVLYVQLNDPDMQLFRTTLIPIVARLPSLKELSNEILLFDEEMRYIVEIDALSEITVGVR